MAPSKLGSGRNCLAFGVEAKEPRNPAMLCGRGAAALELGRKDEAASGQRPSSDVLAALAALLPAAASGSGGFQEGFGRPPRSLEVQSTPAHRRALVRSKALNPKDSFAKWALNSIEADPAGLAAAWLRFSLPFTTRCWHHLRNQRGPETRRPREGDKLRQDAARPRQGCITGCHLCCQAGGGVAISAPRNAGERPKHSKACDLWSCC